MSSNRYVDDYCEREREASVFVLHVSPGRRVKREIDPRTLVLL